MAKNVKLNESLLELLNTLKEKLTNDDWVEILTKENSD